MNSALERPTARPDCFTGGARTAACIWLPSWGKAEGRKHSEPGAGQSVAFVNGEVFNVDQAGEREHTALLHERAAKLGR